MRLSRRNVRRFSWVDALVLAAATAFGLLWLVLLGRLENSWMFFDFSEDASWTFQSEVLPAVALVADPFLAAWTLAWVIIRLRSPRDRWRRLVRQPGATVGLVAILAWIVGGSVTFRWSLDVHHGTPGGLDYWIVQLASSTLFGGFGVMLTWFTSGLAGRWRPEAGWIDRMGRILGVGWVVLLVPSKLLLERHTGPFY